MYGPPATSIEQINNTTGQVLYLHHDQQGSTRLITGSTGKVEGKCSYAAYGTPTCEGAATTPLGYDGQYTSSDTGLVYLRNRVYDPATAQFLTVDPLVGITGEPYSFAFDNPVNLVDPSGLEAIPFPVAGPQDLSACADPITIAICGAGGVYTPPKNSTTPSPAKQNPATTKEKPSSKGKQKKLSNRVSVAKYPEEPSMPRLR